MIGSFQTKFEPTAGFLPLVIDSIRILIAISIKLMLTLFSRKRALKIALEILFIVVVYLALKAIMQRHLVEGIAPPLQDISITGQTVNLQSLKGQPVLVYFWATWCPVCKLEQNSINSINKNHKIITVAISSGNASEVKAYLDKNNLNFPVIVDEDNTIATRFGVRGTPTSFVINRNGEIAFTEVGFTTAWGLKIRLWLAGFW